MEQLLRQLLSLSLVIYAVRCDCPRPPDVDPCTLHAVLDDPTRSTGHEVEGSDADNDYSLEEQWYRSVSGAGGDMPTTAPTIGQCNAFAPIWLNGDMPQALNEIADVDACASFLGEDCIRQYTVPVMNCGDFNVYCLSPTTDAFDRYCFGSEIPCEAGTASATGFTPCTVSNFNLDLDDDPIITHTFDYDELLGFCSPFDIFECNINHDDDNVVFDVQWFADGTLVKEETGNTAVPFAQMPATITSKTLVDNDYFIGTTLTCRVAAREAADVQASVGAARETDFFAGITVDEDSMFIELEEGGNPAFYNGQFTIPYKCFQLCADLGIVPCSFPVDIVTPEHDDDTCTNDQNVVIALPAGDDSCTTSSTETGFSVEIHANADHVYNPERQMVLQLRTRPIGAVPFWEGRDLPRAVVQIIDAEMQMVQGRICEVYDDPHFKSFDQHRFEVQLEGSFIMYKHKTLPILVEAYFVRPYAGARYTNNCGGAVRSGGEVFVYDNCRNGQPMYVTPYQCSEGLQEMTVQELTTTSYKIILPTGTVVVIGTGKQSVTPSVFDYDQTEGLCGNLNGVNTLEDDKILRGTNNHDPGNGGHFNDFSNSWRVEDVDSLYFGVVNDDLQYGDLEFCSCNGDEDNPGAACSSAPNTEYCLDGDHAGAAGNNHRCTLSRRKRRDVEGSDLEDDPRQMFPFDIEFDSQPLGFSETGEDGWTAEEAMDYCSDYFHALNSVNNCAGVPSVDVDAAIAECVLDIEITGSTNYTDLHVDVLTQNCLTEVQRYVFVPAENVEMNLTLSLGDAQDILNQVCPAECSHNGLCQNGVCLCDDGYTDVDCSSEINHIPQLFALPSNGTCDRHVRPCELSIVHGDRFVPDSVYCRMQLKTIRQVPLSEAITVEAEYVHVQKAICPIDVLDFAVDIMDIEAPYYVDIAVSNNGLDFSNTRQLLVYSGLCWQCSHEEGCANVENNCFLADVCYADGEAVPDRQCYVCDGEAGTWGIREGFCLIDRECFQDGMAQSTNSSLLCMSDVTQTSWTDIGECVNEDACVHGQCVYHIDGNSCECFDGWAGELCELEGCMEYNLTYITRRDFKVRLTQADNAEDLSGKDCLEGSGEKLDIMLVDHNAAKMTIQNTNNDVSTFTVKRFCFTSKRVKKVKMVFYNAEGQKIATQDGNAGDFCPMAEEVPGVQKIKLQFKRKASKDSIQLKDMRLDTCID